jgi:nicotinamidase-related amidase
MAIPMYDKKVTALLVIDLYKDFISGGGKVWGRLKGVAEANSCVPHMMQVLDAARKTGIRGFYALHRRYLPGDYESWKYIAPVQKAAWSRKTFEYGIWGVSIVIHNYRWRLSLAQGEPKYIDLERRLAEFPVITVPTITLEGDANGAPHPDPKSYGKKFSGKYSHRVVNGGIGHNLPQEAPQAFAKAVVDVDRF